MTTSSILVRATRIAALCALISLGCSAPDTKSTGESGASDRVAIGAPVPAYTARTISGDSASLGAQRGKVVLLNVWATWCHPCRAEIPELREIHARYQGRGLELVGVSVDNDGADEDIKRFMQEFQMTYPIWRDPDERISSRFLLVGVPATFLIDRDGVLRWRKTGPIAPGDTTLSAAIERALGA